MNVFTLFSGYDSQYLALLRLANQYDLPAKLSLVGWSEIDAAACAAHNALFPMREKKNYGDVTKIDWHRVKADIDLLTYSSPCQDFSSAGLRQGGEKGSCTRSSLLWEVEKAIDVKRPKYLLMENVAALTSVKFLPLLHRWLRTLESYGYKNFAKVLNAKDYEVPQNRERLFVVSILDTSAKFYFPAPMPLKKRLKDILENDVPQSYYLSEKRIAMLDAHWLRNCPKMNRHGFGWHPSYGDGVASTLCVSDQNRCNDNYIITRGHGYVKGNEYYEHAPTVRASSFQHNAAVHQGMQIRRLTPRECFRLMDVDDESINLIQAAGISKTNQYKMAGNSIVVSVLYHIFRKMFVHPECETKQLELF